MGVHNTAAEGVAAMYDSTNMMAFGPVFEDSVQLDCFLEWHREREGQTFYMTDAMEETVPEDLRSQRIVVDDLRKYTQLELVRLQGLFLRWYNREGEHEPNEATS